MSYWMSSYVGNFRENNEDSFLFETIEDFELMILADGMGGHKNGDIASAMAVKIVREFISNNLKFYKSYSNLLVDAVCEANKIIYEKNSAMESSLKLKMGTTLEVVLIHNSNMFFAHVGDSRIYSKFKSDFIQLTTDHSYAQFLYSNGAITADELKNHSEKNRILRAVGTDKSVEVDVYTRGLQKGEIILICSDGLTNELNEFEISFALDKFENPQKMAEGLVDLVKNNTPARDNVTVGIYKNEV